MIRENFAAERIAVKHYRELVRGSSSPKLTRVSLSAYYDADREVRSSGLKCDSPPR
jgi:hypothetical protein